MPEKKADWDYSICNESFEEWPLAQIAAKVAEMGYQGIELAPFTLAPLVTDISAEERTQIRRDVEDAGLTVSGLHWLLAKTDYRLNVPDKDEREAAVQYLLALIDFCADVGGDILVFGSPAQRDPQEGFSTEAAWDWMVKAMRRCGKRANDRGVTFCIESLGTDFITWVDDAARLVEEVDQAGFAMMVDCKSMAQDDRWSVSEQLKAVWPHYKHVHVNDPNLLGPGMGDLDFVPILSTLKELGYDRWLSVETFEFELGPERIARESVANLQSAMAQVR
jgi:sugar phosphate isomerase/epimerase